MCSYLGTFPPALARSVIAMFSEPGDIVMDPFCGRGTTLLESRLLGRIPIASDLSPIAIALSKAKNTSVKLEEIDRRLGDLATDYDRLLYLPEAQVQPDAIQQIFHPGSLAQLCYLKRSLLSSDLAVDHFVLGALLGVMHGSERQDGSSGYASISMPNTFSMSPNYVRKFVATNQLNRTERNVFTILRDKADRLFREVAPVGCAGVVATTDAKRISENAVLSEFVGRVKLVLTSPPYLDVVNYSKQNWIRAWLLENGLDDSSAALLDDKLTLSDWLSFLDSVVAEVEKFLAPNGVLVMVVGDVARAGRTYISLAREFIQRMAHGSVFSYIGCFEDYVGGDSKTTRIWKATKGKATEVDRLIVLANHEPNVRVEELVPALGVKNRAEVQGFNLNARDLAKAAAAFASPNPHGEK